MNAANEIKQHVSMREAGEFYGFKPNRAGFISCPFHADKTPSLKLYDEPGRGFSCYGCGATGSVIDFVMRLFNIGFRQAVVRIDHDFRLNIYANDVNNTPIPRVDNELLAKRAAMRKLRDEYEMKTILYRLFWWAKRNLSPANPIYAEACRELSTLDHYFEFHNYDRAWGSL